MGRVFFPEPNSVRSVLVEMHLAWDAVFAERHSVLKRVFDRNSRIIPGVENKGRGSFFGDAPFVGKVFEEIFRGRFAEEIFARPFVGVLKHRDYRVTENTQIRA